MKNKNNEDAIYELLKLRNTPTSVSWLSKQLGIDRKAVQKNILLLVRKKKIVRSAGKLYGLPTQKRRPDKAIKANSFDGTLFEGKIDTHPDGYAFFIPDTGDDLFVPPNKLNGAGHGDKVRVKKARYRGKLEAHVVDILERGITSIVGRVEERKHYWLVIPFHRKFTSPVYIKRNRGDKYRTDDVVEVKITLYPEPNSRAEGEITNTLGKLDDKGIENLIVMHKYNLVKIAPETILKEAEIQAGNLPLKDNKGRHDFRELFTVTIDGETARDFDDAISVERTSDGFNLYVHIADVAHYVEIGSALDQDAYSRGTSVYFPEFAIPMLPEVLSNGACSLRPDEDRFTLSAKIEYNAKGERGKMHFYQSVIRSNHRLTYTYVNEVLEGKPALNGELASFIGNAHELASLIKVRRTENGALDFDLPDVNFIFDAEGNISDIQPEDRGISERIIENFMIEANEAVAEELDKKAPTAVFRNHGKPDLAKLEQWSKNVRKLGVSLGKVPDEITPYIVQKWFDEIEDKKYSYLLKSMLVRSMQRAEYASENIGHFGLGSEYYTHFTSPIRRYPDLIVHRLLKKYVFKENIEINPEDLDRQAKHCSVTERNAEDAEREVRLYKKLAYLKNNSEKDHDAYINRITSSGFYVFLTELLLSGFVDVSTLPKGRYSFDPEAGKVYHHKGGTAYRLGEPLFVRWSSTDMDTLEAEFMPAQ